jgi:hypothetical protein
VAFLFFAVRLAEGAEVAGLFPAFQPAFLFAASVPGARQGKGNPGVADDLREPCTSTGAMFGQPDFEVVCAAQIVLGVVIWLREVEQVNCHVFLLG